MKLSFKSTVACGVAASAIFFASAVLAQAKTFDIPSQAAAKSIPEFGRQAGLQITAPVSSLRGVRTPSVRGSLEPEAALALLLRGTGLVVVRNDGRTITLQAGPQAMGAAERAPDESQAAESEQTTVEEVIVRATKRDESIMQVPVSMTAVTANDIEKLGAKNLEDLARSVPGVLIKSADEQSDKTFVIRGVSSQSSSATVAVYIDDTPITFGTATPDLKLFDVSQIEILRGPQGTLFGSSSMGGAIRYTSPQPSFAGTTGMVKVEGALLQDGSPDYEIQGMVGGPIIEDRLAFRASAFARHDGGYLELRDEDTGKVLKDDINTVETWGGRAALKLLVTDDIDATLSAIYQKQDSNWLPTFFSARGMDAATPLQPMSRVDRTDIYRDDETFLPNLTINADLGFAKLTSSTSYVRREYDLSSDFSYFVQRALGLPDTAGNAPYGRALSVNDLEAWKFKGWVQEIRLASQGNGPFQWIVGAYYQKTNQLAQTGVPSNLGVVEPFFDPFLLDEGKVFVSRNEIDREQKALFGEVSYTLFDKLKLTAGVRVTEMEIQVDTLQDGFFNGGLTTSKGASKERPVTPKYSAQYTFSPNAMMYVTAAKGFREGGPNRPVPANIPACAAALAQLGLTAAPSSYDTDSVWSYELGAKVQTPDHRLRFSGAVYRVDLEGIQQTINLLGGCGFPFIGNFGKARSQGFEAETTWRPTNDLRFDLGFGYTDAHLTQDLVLGADENGPIVAAPAGTDLANVPTWTLSLAAQYDFRLFNDWDAFVRGQVQYIGDSHQTAGTIADDPRMLESPDFTLVNLRAGLSRGPYEFNVFVNNLFDDDTIYYKSYGNFAPGPAGDDQGYEAQRIRPRTIGASLKRKF
jgi:iron complex outermembrane receptor protein